MNNKPNLLIATPELMLSLDELDINFSTGGLAPVPSAYARALIKEGTFNVYIAAPYWESSLREINDLNTRELKNLEDLIPDNIFLIRNTSFNKVKVEGTNIRIYDDSGRFKAVRRALALSSRITDTVIQKVKPDITWLHDWMVGGVGPVAKAQGLKIFTTIHNPAFTGYASFDEMVDRGLEIRDFEDYNPSQWLHFENRNVDLLASGIKSSDDCSTVSNEFLKTIISEYNKYKSWNINDVPETSLFKKAPGVFRAIGDKYYSFHSDGRKRAHGYTNPLYRDESDLLNSIQKDGLEATIEKRKKNSEELRAETGLKPGGKLCIYANRLFDPKNPYLLIDNAINLAKKYDLRILILASGDESIVNNALKIAFQSEGLVAYFKYKKELEEKAIRSDNSYDIMTPWTEPCGKQNINDPLEGTLVIGHAIDGIKDTLHLLDVANSKGNGFPYNNNNLEGLDWAISQMNKFASLNDSERYMQYIRIANETLRIHSSSAKASQLVKEILYPLYEEKRRENP